MRRAFSSQSQTCQDSSLHLQQWHDRHASEILLAKQNKQTLLRNHNHLYGGPHYMTYLQNHTHTHTDRQARWKQYRFCHHGWLVNIAWNLGWWLCIFTIISWDLQRIWEIRALKFDTSGKRKVIKPMTVAHPSCFVMWQWHTDSFFFEPFSQ